MAGEQLIKIMKSLAADSMKDLPDLMYGEVTALNPMQILVDNRFILDESFLVISQLCKPKAGVWRGLEVGDIVRMLRVGNGQVFYVLERDGDL